MGYPQPNPDLYSKNGYQFFRLNTRISSDGDIYESQQASNGFSIGPDSDISKVNIAYFDDQLAGSFMNQVAISPGRPFPGNVLARNDSKYAPSSRPGRILMWSDELYSSDIPLPVGDPSEVRCDIIVPTLDVVEYFSPLGQIAGRNDKEYLFETIPFSDEPQAQISRWGIAIPFYGRRYASVFVQNADAAIANLAVTFYGVNFKTTGAPALVPIGAGGGLTVATGTQALSEILSSVYGMHDMLLFSCFGGTALTTECTLKVRVSDTEV